MERWEDMIDVDDSDLLSLHLPVAPPTPSPSITSPSISFPPLRSCSRTLTSTSRRAIPGPAGAVQAAMHRIAAAADGSLSGEPGAANDDDKPATDCDDADFMLDPWIQAMSLLDSDSAPPTPIGSISNREDRLPRLVGIVKSCVPNGLGDLFITLKDPTGKIGASVHRKVVSDGNLGGRIEVGCVLILKQVVVFCSARCSQCLNITVNNVEKIIAKDSGAPSMKASTQASPSCLSGSKEDRASPLKPSARINSANVAGEDCPVHGRMRTETTVASDEAEDLLPSIGGESLPSSVEPRGLPTHPSQSIGHHTEMIAVEATCDGGAFEAKKPISAAQWTDEQLEELFADYEDF